MMARYRLCLTCRSRLHALGIESVDKGHAMQRAFHRCPCCKAVLLQLCNNCDMSLLGSCTDGVQQALAQCLCKQGACPPPLLQGALPLPSSRCLRQTAVYALRARSYTGHVPCKVVAAVRPGPGAAAVDRGWRRQLPPAWRLDTVTEASTHGLN